MTTESINLRSWPNDMKSERELRANERSRRMRSSLVMAVVLVAHGTVLYLAINHSSVVLTLQRKPVGAVQMRLVAAPAPQPVKQPEPQPQPKQLVKPVFEKPKKAHVLSSAAPSPRIVAAAPQEKPKVKEATPPAQEQQASPTPVAQAAPAAAAPGPNLPGKPKEIDAGELKQMGCQIPAPDYPAKAKRLQQEGTVVVRLTIGTDGTVIAAGVARSSGVDSLDTAALASIRAGHCRPYTAAGVAQAVQATQPIAFNLND